MNCFVVTMIAPPYWESHRKRSHEPPVIELDFRVFFDSSGVQTPKVTVMRRSTCMMRFPKKENFGNGNLGLERWGKEWKLSLNLLQECQLDQQLTQPTLNDQAGAVALLPAAACAEAAARAAAAACAAAGGAADVAGAAAAKAGKGGGLTQEGRSRG